MARISGFLFIALVLSLPATLFSQAVPRITGLEGNKEYLELLDRDKKLISKEDSVQRVIADTRKLFSSPSSDRQKLGADILSLEKELFEVRDSIGLISSKINRIEQDFIIKNMGRGQAAATTPTTNASEVKSSKNLVYNVYFKDNLSSSDYKTLLEARKRESEVGPVMEKYFRNYDTIARAAAEYAVTDDKEAAAELLSKYRLLTALNKRLEDSLSSVWGYVYDNKTYSYNFLLDKMNRTDLLSDFEDKLRAIRQDVAAHSGSVVSDKIYAYPLEKKTVMDYEKTLAGLLGYKAAEDSIVNAMAALSKMNPDMFALPPVELEERVFIDYEDAAITSPSRYNSSNPIPENEIYSKGTVYKIQVGTFARMQPVSLFRGAAPVCYDILEDGRYRYYVGAYRDPAAVEEGMAKMKRAGFRSPEIVVWRDGVFSNLNDEKPAAAGKTATMYRVEIHGAGEQVNEEVKVVIDALAGGRELSRSVTPEGEYVYTVGSFDNKEEADGFVEKLSAVDGISAKMLSIETPVDR